MRLRASERRRRRVFRCERILRVGGFEGRRKCASGDLMSGVSGLLGAIGGLAYRVQSVLGDGGAGGPRRVLVSEGMSQ